ncbi:MAG: preprotein translocase subunit SecE [Planctomycetota bacterium]
MEAYKPGQASLARLSAVLGLILALFLGCRELYAWIQGPADRALVGLKAFESLPVLGVPLTWKFLLCLGIFVLGAWGVRRLLSKPAAVNALIETESEMKKVSWPTREESFNATMIVIVVSVVLTVALFVFDQVLTRVLRLFF